MALDVTLESVVKQIQYIFDRKQSSYLIYRDRWLDRLTVDSSMSKSVALA